MVQGWYLTQRRRVRFYGIHERATEPHSDELGRKVDAQKGDPCSLPDLGDSDTRALSDDTPLVTSAMVKEAAAFLKNRKAPDPEIHRIR